MSDLNSGAQSASTSTPVPSVGGVDGGTSSAPVQPMLISQPNVKFVSPPLTYTQKVMIAVGISAAAILVAILIWYTAQILVLCFAGVLFAVFISAPSDLLAKHTGMKRAYALVTVLLTLFLVIGGGGYLMGRTVFNQSRELSAHVQEAWQKFQQNPNKAMDFLEEEPPTTAPTTMPDGEASTLPVAPVAAMPVAATEIAPATATAPAAGKQKLQEWVAERMSAVRNSVNEFLYSETFVKGAGGVVTSTFGVIGNIVIVFGVGLFFALHPSLYANGVVQIFPRARRARVSSIMSQMGTQLEWWFVGQLCSMASIGLLTFIGLKILGVPMALTLAILAGLMNFIPNFGPILAAFPAVLVAFAPHNSQTDFSPAAAAWVIGLYIIIQLLEGWVITPFFQQRAVELPPALIIISQVVFALLLGPIGLILATPILAAILVIIRMVYLEDVLGDQPELKKG